MGRRKKQAVIGVMLFLFTLYLWSYKGTSHSPDEWLFIDKMSQALRSGFHTLESDQLQFFGLYALGVPLLVMSQLVETFGAYQILLFLNAFATAITGGIVVLLLLELGYGIGIATAVAIVYGAGTLAWPYSGYLLREPLAAMGLTLAAFMLLRYQEKGGFKRLLGWFLVFTWVSITKRTTSFLIFPFSLYLMWLFYIRKEPAAFWNRWFSMGFKTKALILICIILPAIILFHFLVKNYVPFPQKLSEAFPDLHNLMGLLVSPGWGLLIFCPVLWLTLPGLPGFFYRKSGRGLFLASLGLIYLVASTRAYFWWGFWGWGPRQVNPVLPFLSLPLAETLETFWNKKPFRVIFGVLLLLSTMFAAMQSIMAYPFYEEVFKAGITLQEFTWNLRTSPLLNHWRILNITKAEVVWATSTGMRWGLFAFLSSLLILAKLSLKNAANIQSKMRFNAKIFAILLLISVPLILKLSYQDEDFGSKSGFIEAYRFLRQERSPDSKLIIYMWGEPPWAYIPRVAMLNYCKGLCPPHIVVIKEHFIDGRPEWREQLWQLINDAEDVWVIMQGLAEASPERWVEFALAKRFYLAENKWSGPSVRLVRFKRGGDNVIASGELKENAELSSYIVKAPGSVLEPSDFLYVDLKWKLPLITLRDWKTSLQLLDEAGKVVSQIDYPVSFLMKPEEAREEGWFTAKYALRLPKMPGEYELILVLYSDQSRFIFKNGLDYVKLARVKIL